MMQRFAGSALADLVIPYSDAHHLVRRNVVCRHTVAEDTKEFRSAMALSYNFIILVILQPMV